MHVVMTMRYHIFGGIVVYRPANFALLFISDLKPICSTYPFLHSLSGSIWTAGNSRILYSDGTYWALSGIC